MTSAPSARPGSATLHADALRMLGQWRAPSPEQDRLRARYVAHLREHHDGLTRGCRPDHLTAGTLVVSGDGHGVLLNLHRKARRWFAFGGHCEPGDQTLAEAALREATEESGLTGLAFDPVPVHLDEHVVGFCHPGQDVHHLDVRFRAVAPRTAVPAVSDESLQVRWWPIDALPADLGEEMHALIRASLAA